MLEMYREIWVVDFEFVAHPGERPEPVCFGSLEIAQRPQGPALA